MIKFAYKTLIAIQCIMIMQGCVSIDDLPLFHKNQLEKIRICVEPDLHFSISVDVVFIYEASAASLLGPLDSQQWFTNRAAFIASYGQQLDVLNLEVVPGSSMQVATLPRRHHSAILILAYANYPANKVQSWNLTELQTPLLVFSDGEFSVNHQAHNSESNCN